MTLYSIIQTFDACENEAPFWKLQNQKAEDQSGLQNLLAKDRYSMGFYTPPGEEENFSMGFYTPSEDEEDA